ncbi:MAG: RHS repeat-associated core domain-containing protein, partial [Nanoarchaeota archaeon]|nr:RHS repeat-associated core domain-containing protein [Nanoarchaeota archaeon]
LLDCAAVDYNNDSSVNIADVIQLMTNSKKDINNPDYDLNGDGTYAITDAIYFIQRIQAGECADYSPSPEPAAITPITKVKSYIFAGSKMIATFDENNDLTYYHADHLGTPRVLTDEAGDIVARYDNYPFGETLSEISIGNKNNYKYNAKELDETNLHYYGARYYDQEIGRFTQADKDMGRLPNPQTLNRYTYTANNPLKYIDPDGNAFIPIIGDIADFFAMGMSIGDVMLDPLSGDKWGMLGLDVAGAALPFVPAASLITRSEKVIRTIKKGGVKTTITRVGGFFSGKGPVKRMDHAMRENADILARGSKNIDATREGFSKLSPGKQAKWLSEQAWGTVGSSGKGLLSTADPAADLSRYAGQHNARGVAQEIGANVPKKHQYRVRSEFRSGKVVEEIIVPGGLKSSEIKYIKNLR